MSSVDNRIVQMRFDNKQFEDGIKTSTKSLDKLKEGLNLEESARNLSNLNNVGKSFSLAGISSGIDALNAKFSTLGIIGITAIANIANSAINAGKTLVSSLTVDPIKLGFDEYETKMNAIQTILTNTASKGTTLDDVNKSLNELNKYADQTIYNFAEMTKNIGTFTAAGIDLKTSTESIKGIANLAAGSGSSAQQASTAMYQLSQAMASGTVKLMDWNSVVNAGMGGELFQKALEKTAKELGHGRDMSVSFRESLETGWITTEVLTKTLQKFANDPSLMKAATQVKTFTQLIDTMKESVQSGWAQTWETVIGNKDEASAMLTTVNDLFGSIVGKSADARNAMLALWKTNGGREMFIQAITNAFKGLESIMKPIHEAFKEIFPPMTATRLLEITKYIKDLTASFKIGEAEASNIKRTFKGLFAILDIGKQALSAVAGGLSSLLKNFLPVGGGFLSITGNIGDFLVALDEAIKKSGIFNVVIERVGNFLATISDGLRAALATVADVIRSFANIDTSGLDTFSEKVKARFEPFTALATLAKNMFLGICAVVAKVAPIFYKLAKAVGDGIGKIASNIADTIESADYNRIFDIINGGLFAAILVGIKKFIDSLSSMTKGAGGFLGNITEILDGVKGCLKAYQSEIRANTLLKIAGAMGILAGSLFLLSLIDSAKLTSSLAAMSAMFIELFGSMGVFEKVMGSKGFQGIGRVTFSMIGVSMAILILTDAMTKLSKLDWDGISKGLFGVAGLSAILIATAKLLSKNAGKMIKGSLGLIIFAGAIEILASAVVKLSSLDTVGLAKGLIGVGVLMTELALFMKVTDLSGMGMFKGIGIVLLATSILILADAVKKFSEINATSMIKGLIGIGIILGEIAIFANVTSNSKKVISTAISLTILGSAMLIFAKAIEMMGGMQWESIAKGLAGMAGSLTIVTLALKLMPKNMISKAIGLIGVATALLILSSALQNMGTMSWDEITRGIITLADSLAIITVAMMGLRTALPGAVALLVISGALVILSGVLKMLGSMPITEIGKGLLALVGVFAIIGGSALLLAPIVPVILALSGAIALLGVAIMAIGGGLLLFSAGITALSVAGTAGAAALVLIVTSLIGLIPFALKKTAEGIVLFADVIGGAGPTFVKAFETLLMAVITTIEKTTPAIVNCLDGFLTQVLNFMVNSIPKMIDAGMKLILGILTGVANSIQQVVSAGIDVILKFIMGVSSKLPAIIDTAFKVIISFINGLADAIRDNHNAIYNACANLVDAIIGAITDLLPKLVAIGSNIVQGMIKGVRNMAGSLSKAAADVAHEAVEGVKDFLGIHSPSRVFAEIGKFSMMGFANGITNYGGAVSSEANSVGLLAIDSLRQAMANASSVISDTIDTTPTIRPVIDLTGVTAGADTINSLLNRSQGITVANANIRAASISRSMTPSIVEPQNGSTTSNGTDPTSVGKPLSLQLVLQNGRAIAEYLIDDLDSLIGTKNKITGRTVGV